MIITNNPCVRDKYENSYRVQYIEGTYRDVLIAVRDNVHIGHALYTHPLMGSLKPNETPYRSVIISDEVRSDPGAESILVIEEAIRVYDHFAGMMRPDRGEHASERIKRDFRNIDLSLLESALDA